MTTVPDAAESNAGDDFHILWAARKALSLLNLGGRLRAIRPEGPNSRDAADIDPSGESLLGIDVAEYYGDSSESVRFSTADRVVYSQLKYSTRRPSNSWTVPRLIRGKHGTPKGSVVHRLSRAFKSNLSKFGRVDVLKKLSVALVSNQPCDPQLTDALHSARTSLASRPSACAFASLKKLLSAAQYGLLAEIKRGTLGLQSAEFCDFLRVLDLSQCGSESRLVHEVALIGELGASGFQDVHSQYDSLTTLIRRWMLPENRCAETITPGIVAATLGKPTPESLFPAPARLEDLSFVVDREAVREIATSIKANQLICVHGGAGIGKTTLVRSLAPHLPKGSTVVLFDSYGGGSYLNMADIRHEHCRAIPQIANELAQQVGSSLLLSDVLNVPDLLRELRRRLGFAVNVLRRQHRDALVVIIIDAADNSVAAATHHGGKSFVHDLVATDLPEGCRLVLTARTHRIAELKLPHKTPHWPISPFTESESITFLQSTFPHAGDDQGREFHQLTGGIPRVARYAIQPPVTDLEEAFSFLRPNGQSVASIVDAQLRNAELRAGGNGFVYRACAALIALPRPIPARYVARFAADSPAAVFDLATDFCHGLRVENDHISFRDEDFESHLRERCPPDEDLIARIADELKARSDVDPYAAAHVADALCRAGDKDGLINLVYREREPVAIADPVERKEVFVRRARFALAVAIERNNITELMRLLLLVGDAVKSDCAVEELLLTNADLACRYGNPTTVQRLYLSKENERIGWYGPTHLQCAASFSRVSTAGVQARSHLQAGREWLRWWGTLTQEERADYRLGVKDIAHGAEALIRLEGLRTGIDWLSRWEPAEVVFTTIRALVKTFVACEGAKSLAIVHGQRIRADVALLIIDAAMSACLPLPSDIVTRAVAVWLRVARKIPRADRSVADLGVSLCEAAALHGHDRTCIATLAEFFAPLLPDRITYLDDKRSQEFQNFIRLAVLTATLEGRQLKPEDSELLPVSLQTAPPQEQRKKFHEWAENARPFKDAYAILLPSFQFRAHILINRAHDANADTAARLFDADTTGFYAHHGTYDLYRARVTKARVLAVAICGLSDPRDAFRALSKAIEGAALSLALDITEIAFHNSLLHDDVLRTVDQLRARIESTPMAANEKVSLYTHCCRICGEIDPEVGRFYFESAVKAAAEIDVEVFSLLALISNAAQRAASGSNRIDEPSLAASLSRFVEDCYWKLSDHEHFPWSACIEAIAYLCPQTAEGVLCRWDQRGVIGLRSSVYSLIRASFERAELSSVGTIAWSMFLLPYDTSFLGTTLNAIAALRAGDSKLTTSGADSLELLADIATRHTSLESRKWLCDQIMEWAHREHLNTHPGLDPVRRIHEFTRRVKTTEAVVSGPSMAEESLSLNATEEPPFSGTSELMGARDPCVTEHLEDALRLLPLGRSYGQETHPDREKAVALLRHCKQTIIPNRYVAFLDAIIRISPALLHWWDLEKVLREACRDWGHHPGVRAWKDQLPDLIAAYRYDIFFFEDAFSTYTLDKLQSELGLGHDAILNAVTSRLPERVRGISAPALYDIASRLVRQCAPAEALLFLQQSIAEIDQRRTVPNLATVEIEKVVYPSSVSGRHFSGLLWFLLGHPDTRLRWRAVHVGRALVRLGQCEILRELSRWMHLTRDHPFAIRDTIFYRFAAKQWFLALVDCIAKDAPAAAISIVDVIRTEVFSPEAPHVLCVRLARRIAMRMHRHDGDLFSPHEIEALKSILVSQLPPLRKKARYDKLDATPKQGESSDVEYGFDVDSLDTLPYWYAPLGSKFGVSARFIEKKAGRWVRDVWKFSGSTRHKDPLRNRKESDHEWQLMSNRHGQLPVIEDLQTYFEIHAMHCVAGELLASRRMIVDRRSDWDSWDGWLSKWDVVKGRVWLCDRRCVTPLERRFWFEPSYREWDRPTPSEGFDVLAGMNQPLYPGMIVIWSSESMQMRRDYKKLVVESALVPRTLADSLAHALHWTSTNDYSLPDEKDHGEIKEQIGNDRFFLTGWIRFVHRDSERLEEHDPLRFRLNPSLLKPGRRMKQVLGLKRRGRRPKCYYRRGDHDPCIVVEEWSDALPGYEDREFHTEGRRMWMKRRDVLEFLREGGNALIIKAQETRSIHDYRGSDGVVGDIYDKRAKLFVVYGDGRVETPAGDHIPWEADRR